MTHIKPIPTDVGQTNVLIDVRIYRYVLQTPGCMKIKKISLQNNFLREGTFIRVKVRNDEFIFFFSDREGSIRSR